MAETSQVERLLGTARARIDRVAPADLESEVAEGALVVDLRPRSDRDADGEIPFARVVEMIHVPWRLDATSPDRLPEVHPDTRVILVCNEGYASSLAAATLLDLGMARSTDLEGGARAWFRHRADGEGR